MAERLKEADAHGDDLKREAEEDASAEDRPAYNVQFATATDSWVIVGADVTNAGTDGGQMKPMVDQIERRYQTRPHEYLADGGFVSLSDMTDLEKSGITTFLPIMEQDQKRALAHNIQRTFDLRRKAGLALI